jgi:putative NADPH-quinone reductase
MEDPVSHTTPDDATTTRTALVVVAHPRRDSLTAHIAELAAQRLTAAGYRIDLLDLHAENFDPRMNAADLPEWGNREKTYSPEVENHMRRVLAADVIVAVFPVYWVQVPAILKGWIDRVWNYGFAYGRSKPRLAGKRMLWLGLAGAADDDGNLLLDEALTGAVRDAHYAALEDRAWRFVDDFLARDRVPA